MNESSTNVTAALQYQNFFPIPMIKNVIVVVLGICINYINGILIHTFHNHQIFYMNPRYILFIHLVINDMIQLTLTVSLVVISYTINKISVSVCCILTLLAVITTENSPLNLACMAVERYVAICHPLHHLQICTVRRTRILVGLMWVTTSVSALPDLFITLATQPLSFFHSQLLCLRQNVFPNPIIVQKMDVTYIVYLVIIWFIIFYTYFRILFTARTASKDAKKARNTILLHGFQLLLCMAMYIFPQLLSALTQWFPKNFADSSFVCYVIVQVLPRSISPVIYGVRDNTFRKYLKKHMFF